jgi:DNA primase
MDNVLSKYDITLDHDRVKVLGELENIISEVYSEAERDIYIQNVSKKLGVDPKSIKSDVARILSKKQRSIKKDESQKAMQIAAGYSDKINRDFAKAPTVAKHEEVVLGLLLLFPEHRKLVFEEGIVNEESFFTEFNKRVFNFIKNSYEDNDKTYDLNESFTPEEVGRITKMKLTRMNLTENGEHILRESINSLKSSMQKRSAMETSTASDLESLISKFRSED